MKKEFKEALENSPIIVAIKDDEGLKKCKTSDSQVVFILYGDICNIPDIVDEVKSAGKLAFVHLDLITGLSAKEIAADFVKRYTKADGIITTKPTESLQQSPLSSSGPKNYPYTRFCAFSSLIPWPMRISNVS